MAFTKDFITKEGITTTYHKIGTLHLMGDVIKCNVISYEDEEARAEDRPFITRSFKLFMTVEEEESMGIRALCYKKLKELPEWADAEDC